MKKITGGATKITRLIITLMTVLLTTGAAPTVAGILDTINSKVTTIQNRTSTILSNTNGVQDLVTNVRGITTGFRSGIVSDLQETLGEAQDLVAFLKEQRESAGSPADYPDLSLLITSLESIVGALQDNPNGADFGVLSQLLQILPDRVLAVAARGVSRAGIDAEFVTRTNQIANDVAVLRDLINEDAADLIALLETQVEETIDIDFPTACDRYNNNERALKLAANALSLYGADLNLVGKMISATAQTTATGKKVGVHGYVGFTIETDSAGSIGKIISGIGSALTAQARTVNNKLRHCEIIFNQDKIKALNEQLINSNQQVLDSNAVLLEEVCRLTRYRSANCQALLP